MDMEILNIPTVGSNPTVEPAPPGCGASLTYARPCGLILTSRVGLDPRLSLSYNTKANGRYNAESQPSHSK